MATGVRYLAWASGLCRVGFHGCRAPRVVAFQAETPELQSKQPSRPEDFFAVLAELSRVVLVLSRLQPRFCSVTFRRNGRVSVVLLCSISWAELLLSIAIESRVCVCVWEDCNDSRRWLAFSKRCTGIGNGTSRQLPCGATRAFREQSPQKQTLRGLSPASGDTPRPFPKR